MIAIQRAGGGFDKRWMEYCEDHNIDYKLVDCYRNDIINQLIGCKALMWQFYQGNPKDILMAKCLMFSLEQTGLKVFPDFRSSWHFDDKVGQKYLLEAIGAPLAQAWVFYKKNDAIDWISKTSFPKVFKLRGGSGSQNVRLVKNEYVALRLIKKAFSKGFPQYDPLENLHERWRLYRLKKTSMTDVIKGIIRFLLPPPYAIQKGNEKGYIYFQDFIPDNDHDIRVIVIGDKAFAIKRLVRENDFRASGSSFILYDKNNFDDETVRIAFYVSGKLKSQCMAYDFVYLNGKPLIVEISYGFSVEGYNACPGYWDKDLVWHEGKFNPYEWMVEDLLRSVEKKA